MCAQAGASADLLGGVLCGANFGATAFEGGPQFLSTVMPLQTLAFSSSHLLWRVVGVIMRCSLLSTISLRSGASRCDVNPAVLPVPLKIRYGQLENVQA